MRTDGVVLAAFRTVQISPKRRHIAELLQKGNSQVEHEAACLRDIVAKEGLEELLQREEERKKAMRAERRMNSRSVSGGTSKSVVSGESSS
jgi:hypothetical protein